MLEDDLVLPPDFSQPFIFFNFHSRADRWSPFPALPPWKWEFEPDLVTRNQNNHDKLNTERTNKWSSCIHSFLSFLSFSLPLSHSVSNSLLFPFFCVHDLISSTSFFVPYRFTYDDRLRRALHFRFLAEALWQDPTERFLYAVDACVFGVRSTYRVIIALSLATAYHTRYCLHLLFRHEVTEEEDTSSAPSPFSVVFSAFVFKRGKFWRRYLGLL